MPPTDPTVEETVPVPEVPKTTEELLADANARIDVLTAHVRAIEIAQQGSSEL